MNEPSSRFWLQLQIKRVKPLLDLRFFFAHKKINYLIYKRNVRHDSMIKVDWTWKHEKKTNSTGYTLRVDIRAAVRWVFNKLIIRCSDSYRHTRSDSETCPHDDGVQTCQKMKLYDHHIIHEQTKRVIHCA